MIKVTNVNARRWGTLLVLVGGMVIPIGTASAQDRDREQDRGHGRIDAPGQDRSRRTGRDERDEARRAQDEARAQQQIQQSAALAAQEHARQELAVQRATMERARQEQARRDAAIAAQQQAQQAEIARQQALITLDRERGARRESWMNEMRQRREAQLAEQHQRRAWATVNQRIWMERRGHAWTVDAGIYTGESRMAVRAELRRHALRNAYLVRLREVASEFNEPGIFVRVELLTQREASVHERRMRRLGAGDGPRHGDDQMR
jgi:hypothetical protein